MYKRTRHLLTQQKDRGDTIVEVLIAIAVAAFAIGTAYAISNKSLQNAISARERNEAINILQSQVSDLKNRYKFTYFNNLSGNPTSWNSNFVADSLGSVPGPYTTPQAKLHFCLMDTATNPTDPSWLPQKNNISNETQAGNLTVPPYNDVSGTTCVRHLTTNYYIDIAAEITSTTAGLPDPTARTVYKVAVRWSQIGTSEVQKAEIFYRF